MTPSRKIALLLIGTDFVSTIVVFNLVSFYRGTPAGFLFWPLLTPWMLLVMAIKSSWDLRQTLEMR